MKALPDGSVDAVITDPPWFTPASHYQSRVQWQRNYGDLSPLKVWWDVMSSEMHRVTAKTGHALAFCSGDSLAAFYPGFYGRWPKMDTLVWDKKRPGLGAIWRGQHELIIAARNEDSQRKDDGVLRGDVLAFEATPSAERDHPVQKPVELYAALIDATTNDGNLVFDPFLGSGTLGVAAKQLGRHFLGFEISPEYCAIARDRIARVEAQPNLFEPKPTQEQLFCDKCQEELPDPQIVAIHLAAGHEVQDNGSER